MISRSSSGLSTVSAGVLEKTCSWRTVVVYWGSLRPPEKNRAALKIFWHYCGCNNTAACHRGCWALTSDWCPRASWDIPKAFLVWRHCWCKCSQGQHQNNTLNISRFLLVWRDLGWFPSQGVKLSINAELLYSPRPALAVTCSATATTTGHSATALGLQGGTDTSHNSEKMRNYALVFYSYSINHYLKPLKIQGKMSLKHHVTRT